MSYDETRIAVLETKVAGLEDRLADLKGSILLIENKIETRFAELTSKIESLFTVMHKDAGAIASMDKIWRILVPLAAAITGALISRHFPLQ